MWKGLRSTFCNNDITLAAERDKLKYLAEVFRLNDANLPFVFSKHVAVFAVDSYGIHLYLNDIESPPLG